MKCVTIVSFQILINDQPLNPFTPQCGLRQGDPLSPYLFLICADVLSNLIIKAQDSKIIQGIKIAKEAPRISHLLFADDSLIFCKATIEEAQNIKDIITKYERASGQKVNYDKSEIIFSKKTNEDTHNRILQILNMNKVENFSKYLGIPTHLGRSKRQVFDFIQDRVLKKLKGWKEKHLSFAGRGTLIKIVAQTIATYIMSGFPSLNTSATNWRALFASSSGEVLLTLKKFIGSVGPKCARQKRMMVWGSEVLEDLMKPSLPSKVGES